MQTLLLGLAKFIYNLTNAHQCVVVLFSVQDILVQCPYTPSLLLEQ